MSQTTLIAVVEDDAEIRELVRGLLAREGFDAVACKGASDLDRVMTQRRVDLVVLDLMLAGEDGLSICRRLRGGPRDTPVLMVSAKGDDIDRVLGLEIGADDYLPKPFNPRELVARVRSILRRTRDAHRPSELQLAEIYRFAGWTLDAGSRALADPEGRSVDLTGGEFDLLMAFVTHPHACSTATSCSTGHGDETLPRSTGPLTSNSAGCVASSAMIPRTLPSSARSGAAAIYSPRSCNFCGADMPLIFDRLAMRIAVVFLAGLVALQLAVVVIVV
jgi:two-component system OmpR family response regulator